MIALIIQGRLFKSICMCNDENNPHILYNLCEKDQDILTSAIVYAMGNYFVTNITQIDPFDLGHLHIVF